MISLRIPRLCSSILTKETIETFNNSKRLNKPLFSTHSTEIEEKEPVKDVVFSEKLGSITVIHINRPDKRNCLNFKTAVKLKEALNSFNCDEKSNVGIIYGEGGNFCSGIDCEELAADSSSLNKFHDLRLLDEFSRKPLIAAVNGYAVGEGFDLALWCDLRVVEDTAIFGYFNRRLGVPTSNNSIRRLVDMVGKVRALDWVSTGRIVRSKEAFHAGVASRLVACGTAYGQSHALAKNIEKYPVHALMWDRINLYYDSLPKDEQERLMKLKSEIQSSVEQETATGAQLFMSGIGRHGTTSYKKN